MFTINKRSAVIYSLAAVLFLFHAFADARLVRLGGRGSVKDSNAISHLLVNDNNINDLGLMDGFISLEGQSFNSGDDGLLSTPQDCVRSFDSQFDLDQEKMFGGFVEEPCYYQVYENDLRLQMEGFGRAFFDLASSVEVTWTLSKAGMADIVLMGSVFDSAALLEVLMPPELMPGEYTIGLDVTFFSGPDNSFFSSNNSHDLDVIDCVEPTPGDLQCYHPEWGSASDTLSFSAAYTERLVVLAGTDPLTVNAPAGLSLFLLGLVGIRRRQQ